MVQPNTKRFLSGAGQDEGERSKRQNSGDLRPRSRRVCSEEEEYTTDETSEDEEDEPVPSSSSRKSKPPRRWQPSEDRRLAESVKLHGEANWKAIAAKVGSRNHVQCLQRWKKVLRPGLVKGQWSPKEDAVLMKLASSGYKNWGVLSNHMPGRTSKQCRERWCHHLDPSINKGAYTPEEDMIIIEAQATLGNKWSRIASRLPGRTENSIKIRCKALQRKSTSGGTQSAPSSPRASRKFSSVSTSSSRRRQSSASSASSVASATSGVSAADSFADQQLSEVGDEPLDTNYLSQPTPQSLPPAAVGNFDVLPYAPSANLSAPSRSATSFSTPHSPFFQQRVAGRGGSSSRLDHAASYPIANVPTPVPTAEPGGHGWWWPWSKTPATVDPAARSSVPVSASAPNWPTTTVAAAATPVSVKGELTQQRLPSGEGFNDYPLIERSTPACSGNSGGCASFDGAAVPTADYPRTLPCGSLTQAPLSQYFEYGLNTVTGQEGSGAGLGMPYVAQPCAVPGASLFAAGPSPSPSVPEGPGAGDVVATADKCDGEMAFGDFNALGVDDLKAAVGGYDDDDNAAPLRSCCSFLDLPSEGMVVGDMPLSW